MSEIVGDKFVVALMDNILDGLMTSKFQVERAISPILGVFLEDVLTQIFNNEDVENPPKRIEMVCAEFPLRKKGKEKHSTNVDWLLYDRKIKQLIFFELKTSDTSFDQEAA